MTVSKTSDASATEFLEQVSSVVDDFRKGCNADEISFAEVILSDGSRIRVGRIDCRDPNVIIIQGEGNGGDKVRIVCHQSTFQLILKRGKKETGKNSESVGFIGWGGEAEKA